MEIKINDQPLEVTLEQEKTLGEVISGLDRWLESSNMVVCSAHSDTERSGRDLLSSHDWESLPIEKLGVLNVIVKHADELLRANLHTVGEFLAFFDDSLCAGDPARIGELITGIPYLVESVQRQFSPDLQSDLVRLNQLLANTSAEKIVAWPRQIRDEALRLISVLRERTARRLRELEKPEEVLRELAAELAEHSESLSDVSILLQTGRDREAMETVIRFSDLSGRLARIIAYIRAGKNSGELPAPEQSSLEYFYRDLNTVLEELVEAFHCHDSVLIGDLLEYEIAPRLETLKGLVQEFL